MKFDKKVLFTSYNKEIFVKWFNYHFLVVK